MIRALATTGLATLTALGAGLAGVLVPSATPLLPAATSVAEPVRSLTVTGPGVATYPAFDPARTRYAATTSAETGGALTVIASTTDPAGRVWVDGVLEPDGTATVTGLAGGDEVPVFVEDTGGRTAYAVVYLPPGFPTLETTVSEPGRAAGDVLLTLNSFEGGSAPTYEVSLDDAGVPSWLRESDTGRGPMDLKPNDWGGYTVFRSTEHLAGGADLVELDSAFEEVRRLRTVGLEHTDAHDAILRRDGSRILLAYEPDPETGRIDAVIQEVDAAGAVVAQWNSRDHLAPVAPGLAPGEERAAAVAATDTMNPYEGDVGGAAGELRPDYAHVNSIQLVDGGQNLLVSFRHTSSVLKLAWASERTDGRQQGEVLWRLGGRHSDFEFVDDPYAGPCAQHTASQLPDGNVLIFDNGSPPPGNGLFPDAAMCVDPEHPDGAPVGRAFSRVTEYALEPATGTARLVWSYRPAAPWFAYFAGGVTRLPNGSSLISWASARNAVVTEVDAAGEKVWELRDARVTGAGVFFSYRATKAIVPDAIAPQVAIEAPRDGATVPVGAAVPVSATCRDRGGSTLQHCTVHGADDGLLDTGQPGPVTLGVEAIDGAGNVVRVRREYDVVAAAARTSQPDLVVRRRGGPWVGQGVHGAGQVVRDRLVRGARAFRVRVHNDGPAAARVQLRGTRGDRVVRVRYLVGGRDVTRAVVRGRYRTPLLQPGEQTRLRVRVERGPAARPGDRRAIRLRSTTWAAEQRQDRVRMVVRVRRG